MSWAPGNQRSGAAAVGAMPETVSIVRDWGRGDCHLRLSSSSHGLPWARCSLVSAYLQLRVDRYFDNGHLESHDLIGQPLRLSDAGHLATIQAARDVVLSDVVMEYYGHLPYEALGFLAERLAQYMHGVAASRAQAEAAPIWTEVYADAHIRMLVGEEGEEEEEEEGELMDDDGELQAPTSPAGAAETAVVEGQVDGKSSEEEEEEEGEERCSICLEKMEEAGGERERCWLPCAHSFHRACVGRWLQQKGQCPLCRLQVVRQA